MVPAVPTVDRGYALPELLVASVILLVVMTAGVLLLVVHFDIAATQPDVADLTQRTRAVADTIADELINAGFAGDLGAADLAAWLPALQPRRVGARSADSPGTARDNALTVVRVVPGGVVTRLASPFSGGVMAIQTGPPCRHDGQCGLRVGDTVVMYDAEGHHDFVTIDSMSAGAASVSPRQSGPVWPHAVGAFVAPVETRTYYFDADDRQLRLYDGDALDAPVADDVVGLTFDYWGEPAVPSVTKGEAGVATCWYAADGTLRGGAESVPGAPLVRLDLSLFRDGPWCGAGDNSFDADLLRIRRVRVHLRAAAASTFARGTGADFLRPGTANSARRLVPDIEAVVDVTPRNLNRGR